MRINVILIYLETNEKHDIYYQFNSSLESMIQFVAFIMYHPAGYALKFSYIQK